MTEHQNRREVSGYFENDSSAIGAAASLTFNMASGTDTGTNRYLNLPTGVSYGIEIIPTVACSITAINGNTLKAPISVPVNGYISKTGRFTSITITAGSATVVEVGGKC